MLRRCCLAADSNVSGAVWESQWSAGSRFVGVGSSVETPSFNSFNIMIRKMLRCCGFLLATGEQQTASGRMRQPGVNVMEPEEFVFLSSTYSPHIMLQLLLTSCVFPHPYEDFSFFGSLLSFVLYVTTSDYRRDRRLSPGDRKQLFNVSVFSLGK